MAHLVHPRNLTYKFVHRRDSIFRVFSGSLIQRGGRSRAKRFFSYLLYLICKKYRVNPLTFIEDTLETCRPKVFLVPKRIAGVTHQVPMPISKFKSQSIAIHWIVRAARRRRSSSFARAFVSEFFEVYTNSSSSVLRKRDEVHRLAYLNKTFLRFYRFL